MEETVAQNSADTLKDALDEKARDAFGKTADFLRRAQTVGQVVTADTETGYFNHLESKLVWVPYSGVR